MTDRIDRKLTELGLSLPEAAAPVAAYVPIVEAVPAPSVGPIAIQGTVS